MPKKGAVAAPTETVLDGVAHPDGSFTPDPPPVAEKPAAKPRSPATSSKVDLSGSLTDEDDIVSVTYWGTYGSGKTVDVLSMAKLPQPGKVLLVNSEAGAKHRSLVQHGIDTDRIVPWPPRGQEVSYAGLEQLFYTVAGQLQQDPDSWLGCAWDSTTSIEAFLLEQVIAADVAKKNEILRAANKDRSGNIEARDPFDAETDDYIKMQAQFRSLFRKFRYLNWHFAMTALVRRDEDRKTKKVSYGPAVSPKLQNEVGGGPDIVIRTLAIETPAGPLWYGRTFPTTDEPAKDRFGVLPREMVNPTFDRIVAYVRGELTEQEDPDQKLLPGGPTPPRTSKVAPARKPQAAPAQETAADTANRQAKQQVQADVAGDPKPARPKRTPTRPARQAAERAPKPKPSELGSNDNPPF